MTAFLRRTALATIVFCFNAISNTLAQDFPYAFFELPPLSHERRGNAPYSINEHGQLAGSGFNADHNVRAVVWWINGIHELGAIGGNQSEAEAINDLCEVVGWSGISLFSSPKAFLWRNNEMISLGTLGGDRSQARSINNSTQIVGFSQWAGGGGGGFIWENGEMQALPTLGRSGGTAFDINNRGQIVGWSVPEFGEQTAVLWENGQVLPLPHLGFGQSAAIAINDLGQIVGQSQTGGTSTRAVAWEDGQIFNLHRPGLGQGSSAWGINNPGQAVGWVGTAPGNKRAFIWDIRHGMRLLETLVPPQLRTNWRLEMAQDINDAGQIAAYGFVVGDPWFLHAFLISPVYPTMDLTPPSPGRAGEVNTLTVTGATPGALVHFLYSRHGGGTRIPNCDLQQNALQIDNPIHIGSAIADPNGTASITRHVPPAARGRHVLLQAVVVNDCAISQLVVHRFD